MRTWTMSARVVLAWSILPIILVAAVLHGPAHRAQANTRTAGNTKINLAAMLSVAAAPLTSATPAARYVVQPGDTLAAIATRFAVPGGWPALYAANRPRIGPNPGLIQPGTVLVLPGRSAPTRYTVTAGDTLSGIAADLAVRGGWPALYAANRPLIGPDPNVIHPGTVLTVPRPTAPSPPARPHPAAPPSPPASHRHDRPPAAKRAAVATGMPQWLKTMLLAVGLLILVAFLAEPVVAARRRRQQAAVEALQLRKAGPGQEPGPRRLAAENAHIVLADHDRLVVTHNKRDDTVCVLRPPGEDPKAILRVARLVMPEGPYAELAEQLGMPASWPMT
jgi:LysM repeat protein